MRVYVAQCVVVTVNYSAGVSKILITTNTFTLTIIIIMTIWSISIKNNDVPCIICIIAKTTYWCISHVLVPFPTIIAIAIYITETTQTHTCCTQQSLVSYTIECPVVYNFIDQFLVFFVFFVFFYSFRMMQPVSYC